MDLEQGSTRHKLYRTYCSGAEAPGQHLCLSQHTAVAVERERKSSHDLLTRCFHVFLYCFLKIALILTRLEEICILIIDEESWN